MKNFLLLIILIFALSCSSKNRQSVSTVGQDTLIKVLSYGYPSMYAFQQDKVAHKYGFRFITVADCEVTDKLVDSVATINKIAYLKIEKLNGKDWNERYERDILTEFTRDSTIIAKIEKLDFIKDKDRELEKWGNGLDFFVDSSLGQDIYRVNVLGYLDSTPELVSYFRIFYSYIRLDTISVNKKILHF